MPAPETRTEHQARAAAAAAKTRAALTPRSTSGAQTHYGPDAPLQEQIRLNLPPQHFEAMHAAERGARMPIFDLVGIDGGAS